MNFDIFIYELFMNYKDMVFKYIWKNETSCIPCN